MTDSAHNDPEKKHRHDVGDPDHGAASTEPMTRAIQFVLGGAILGTAVLLVWTLAIAG